jgi:hypothetical protein
VAKDRPSFLWTSIVLLVALALRVRVVGDLAGADFPFLAGRSPVARYARGVLRRLHRIRVLGGSVAATLKARGLSNTIVVWNGVEEPPGARTGRTFPDGEARFLYPQCSGTVAQLTISWGLHPPGRPRSRISSRSFPAPKPMEEHGETTLPLCHAQPGRADSETHKFRDVVRAVLPPVF